MVGKKSESYVPWILMVLATLPVVILLFQVVRPEPLGEGTVFVREAGKRVSAPGAVVDDIRGKEREDRPASREKEPMAEPYPPSHLYRGIEGRVVDGVTGRPVPAFTIYYCRESKEDPRQTIELAVRLGEAAKAFRTHDGRFKILDLEEGIYDIAVKAQGYPVHFRRAIEVPAKERTPLRIELPRGNYIEGRVVDGEGRPVEKAMVYLKVEALDNPVDPLNNPHGDTPPTRRAARTGADGTFLFGGLPPGRYGLALNSLSRPMAEAKEIYIGGGGTYRELVMPALSSLEITVTDAYGHPLPNASIRLWDREGKTVINLQTDMYGRASRRVVPPGNYDLRIWKSTYTPWAEKDFTILPGSGIIRIQRALRKRPAP